MNKISRYGSNQQGFSILGAFFLLAILIGAVAFFISGNGVNASQGQNYTAKARASGVITQGGYLSGGFNTMIASGIDKATITMDASATTGLFNPQIGGVSLQVPDPASMIPSADQAVTDGVWTIKTILLLNSDTYYAFAISGISNSVCQEINNANGITGGGIEMIGVTSTDGVYDFSALPDFVNRQRACGLTDDLKNVYYQTTGVTY